MSLLTAEKLVREAFEGLEKGGQVTFFFQGGEPTLAGLPFYDHFVKLAEARNRPDVQMHYAIQTNGILIDEQWADFFARHHFLVGISLDGDQTIHNRLRQDAFGRPTWGRVTSKIRLLQKKKADVNILCVVTGECAKRGAAVYRSLRETGIRYLQFIPCLDPLKESRGSMPYSLRPEDYERFLKDVFDLWYDDWRNGHYVSVRLFDDYVHLAMGFPAGSCAAGGRCGTCPTVEGDGSVYPCDFYCLDDWRLGKIGETPLAELMASPLEKAFLASGDDRPKEDETGDGSPSALSVFSDPAYHADTDPRKP